MTNLIQYMSLIKTPSSLEEVENYIQQLPKDMRFSAGMTMSLTWNFLAAEVNPKFSELEKEVEQLEAIINVIASTIGEIDYDVDSPATDKNKLIVLDGLLEDYHNEY